MTVLNPKNHVVKVWGALDLGPLWVLRHGDARPTTAIIKTVAEPAPKADPNVYSPSQVGWETSPAESISEVELSESGINCDSWDKLRRDVSSCSRCVFSPTRRNVVLGTGTTQNGWLIIGEAPGEEEDIQGVPFVGRSGQLLDQILKALRLDRQTDIYITNVLKCRPPNNRDPSADEVNNCRGFLVRQLALLKPKGIMLLGRFAAQTILASNEPISRLRGKVLEFDGLPVVVSFHPSYLLRFPAEKAKAWKDWQLAYTTFAKARP